MSVRDHGKAFTGIVYSRKGQRGWGQKVKEAELAAKLDD